MDGPQSLELLQVVEAFTVAEPDEPTGRGGLGRKGRLGQCGVAAGGSHHGVKRKF